MVKVHEILEGEEIEGLLVEVICGTIIMSTWFQRRITYHTSAHIPPLFARLEGHVISFTAQDNELKLLNDYGRRAI